MKNVGGLRHVFQGSGLFAVWLRRFRCVVQEAEIIKSWSEGKW